MELCSSRTARAVPSHGAPLAANLFCHPCLCMELILPAGETVVRPEWNKGGLSRPSIATSGLPDAEKLRKYANWCQRFAGRTKDPGGKTVLLEMAAAWLTLAAQIERTEALLGQLHRIPPRDLN